MYIVEDGLDSGVKAETGTGFGHVLKDAPTGLTDGLDVGAREQANKRI